MTRAVLGPAEAAWLALNPRQQLFVQAYLRTWNATAAAMEAGYSRKKPCAKVQGHRLMARRDIRAAVSYGMRTVDQIMAARALDAALVLSRLVDERPITAVTLRAAIVCLRIAGVLPVSRPRPLRYKGVTLG